MKDRKLRMRIQGLRETVKRAFKNGFFDILIGGTLSKCIAFLSSIIIIRLVDKIDYSHLAYADNLYSYVILISGLGMTSSILRYCVSKKTTENKAFFKFSLLWGTVFELIVIALFLLCNMFFNSPFPEAKPLIFTLAAYPLLEFWLTLIQSYLRTQFKTRLYAISSFSQVLCTLILSIALVLKIGIYGISLARNLALILTIFMILPYVIKQFKGIKRYRLTSREWKPFVGMGISMMIANIFSMIMPLNESFLINNIIRSETVTASYKVASLIPSQLPFITTSIIIYFFPIFAQKTVKSDIWLSAKKIGQYTFICIAMVSLVGMIMTPAIIKIVYGGVYSDTVKLSIALWIVFTFNAGFRMLPMNLLPALGYVRFNMKISIISSVIHAILDYFLISRYGINGAIWAIGFIYILSGTVYWRFLYGICKE